jgi:hypothetical protein
MDCIQYVVGKERLTVDQMTLDQMLDLIQADTEGAYGLAPAHREHLEEALRKQGYVR